MGPWEIASWAVSHGVHAPFECATRLQRPNYSTAPQPYVVVTTLSWIGETKGEGRCIMELRRADVLSFAFSLGLVILAFWLGLR